MKNAIKLNGYSGYEVWLYKNKEGLDIVRKQSKVVFQNERLKKQYEKHFFFSNLKTGLFFIPRIVRRGYKNRLFFYEYEFIRGETFIHFVQDNLAADIRIILDKIVKILTYFGRNNFFYEQDKREDTFFNSLAEKILANLERCKLNLSVENQILKKMYMFQNRSSLRTLCHGDFSFDNLIIDKNLNIWLIDFLDLFYPHYWFDISKLFQDIDGRWYEIKHKMRLPNNKMFYIRDYLLTRIKKIDKEYVKYHNFLLMLVFLRILPYAKNGSHKKIIKDKITYFLNL